MGLGDLFGLESFYRSSANSLTETLGLSPATVETITDSAMIASWAALGFTGLVIGRTVDSPTVQGLIGWIPFGIGDNLITADNAVTSAVGIGTPVVSAYYIFVYAKKLAGGSTVVS